MAFRRRGRSRFARVGRSRSRRRGRTGVRKPRIGFRM